MGHLSRLGNGSTPSRSEPEFWSDGVIPWLSSGKINEEIINEADEFVTESAVSACHLPKVPPHSVLVAITGEGQTRGRAALVTFETTVNQHLVFLVPARHVMKPTFLHRYLSSQYQWLRWESSGGGSTRAAITCEFLRAVLTPVPPLEEQEAIVVHLDVETSKLDALIAKVRTAIDRLQELRAALISAAVTGKIDVREEAP